VAAKVAASVPPAAATATLKPTVARTSTKSFVSAVKVKSGSKIVTTSGTVYENVEVEKKTSDGMYISYSLSGGGIAVSKIFFNELSPETLKFYASK
jgi:predicted TIM-barrel enzyme